MRLEPGGAFGSGRHATTRTCLRVIQERVRVGARVLDAGSGSGILSVAAVLFGAREAHGFDIDPNARPYAEALAEDNGVRERCSFATGGLETIDAQYDIVLANLYSDLIRSHAHVLRDALEPSGWFAFSGCAQAQAEATATAIRACGLAIEETLVRGRWHTFVGSRF